MSPLAKIASTRNDHTTQNPAMLRRLALNLLQCDPARDSIRLKIKKAGWSNPYLKSLLAQMR